MTTTHRLVGGVVLVAHQGALIYQQAAGWADREHAQPMALGTIFRLASVSKPIVSTAALVLVAQGKLCLDDDISRWLPEFQPRLADGSATPITVRQLLSHTAGLSYRFFETDANGPYARAGVSDGMDASGITLDENLRRLASVPLLYAPGSAWGYSLATDVLDALIARVHGTSLDKAVCELVTGPLGMVDTGFHVDDAQRVATAYVNDTTQPHRLAEGETVSPFEGAVGITYSPARIFDADAFPSGGAGMAGTASDLLSLLEALRQGGGALLPDALIGEMGHDQTRGFELPNAPGFGFGLGFSVLRDPRLADSPESPGTWRWGGAYGHAWFVDRARGLSVVALTNTLYEGMSGRFVTDLRDAVYGALEPSTMTSRKQDCLPLASLLALATAAFITILTEALPAGLLPQMAQGLAVSEAWVGQTVTFYAIGSLVAAIPLTAATQGMRRRPLLLLALAGFVIANTVTTFSGSYLLTMVARFLAGVSAGLLWALLAGYAARMVPDHQKGRAIAIAMVGTPLALSLGVPAGTFLGHLVGWRMCFGLMSVLALLLMLWVRVQVPDFAGKPAGQRLSLGAVFVMAGVRPVLFVVLAFVLAHNILYTYIAPFLAAAGMAERTDVILD